MIRTLAMSAPKKACSCGMIAGAFPKGGPNVEAAHEFINYILQPEIHASIAKTTRYALPNGPAKKLMPADYPGQPIDLPG